MGMTGFSDAEMALLSGLDAVAWVTRTRITYTDSFKREAVTRYRRGESPVRIFREAGLDPRIIGNKRIERCIARWKREPVLLQCLFDRFGSVFPQCGLMVFPGVVIVSR